MIEYFACFGGLEGSIEIDPFGSLEESVVSVYMEHFEEISELISPSYLLEEPFRDILIATARGDGKLFNVFKRAKLPETIGGAVVNQIVRRGILKMEKSREEPTPKLNKQPIKKELRGYRIQPKVRFIEPFHRFWFGFVEPYRHTQNRERIFLENFKKYRDKTVSIIFEQLSNQLLAEIFKTKDPIISQGNFWDRKSEFDLLCYTKSGEVILGECKFRGKKICKNELNKLKEKAKNSNIKVDKFALFSKNGFSIELKSSRDDNLLLFDLDDFKLLLR